MCQIFFRRHFVFGLLVLLMNLPDVFAAVKTDVTLNDQNRWPAKANGLVIFFNRSLLIDDRNVLSEFYTKHSLVIDKQFSRVNVESVKSKNWKQDIYEKFSKQPSLAVSAVRSTFNKDLERTCLAIRKLKFVRDCFLNLPLELSQCPNCPTPDPLTPYKDVINSVHSSSCELIQNRDLRLLNAPIGLTVNWAKELTGGDLAKDTLDQYLKDKNMTCTVPIGMFDGGFSKGRQAQSSCPRITGTISKLRVPATQCPTHHIVDFSDEKMVDYIKKDTNGESTERDLRETAHGDWVSSIINNPITGYSRHAYFKQLMRATDVAEMTQASEFFMAIEPTERPRIINQSTSWRRGVIQAAEPILSRGVILVTSAGNSFSHGVEDEKCKSQALVIGAINERGTPERYSQQASCVVVSAPGSFVNSCIGDHGYPGSLTSSATPQVSGALANVDCLLPGFDSNNAKALLRNSAIPMLASTASGLMGNSPQNGSGILNALLMVEVANKVRSQCGEDKKCITTWLNDPKIYQNHFTEKQEQDLQAECIAAFPECESSSIDPTVREAMSCADRRKVLEKLHRAALLRRTSKSLWNKLACIYRNEGFTKNAELYENIADAIEPVPWEKVLARSAHWPIRDRFRLAHALSTNAPFSERRLLAADDPDIWETRLSNLPPPSKEVIEQASRSSNPKILISAARAIQLSGEAKHAEIVARWASMNDEFSQYLALLAHGPFDQKSMGLVQRLRSSKNPTYLAEALQRSAALQEPTFDTAPTLTFEMLNEIPKDMEPQVMREFTHALSFFERSIKGIKTDQQEQLILRLLQDYASTIWTDKPSRQFVEPILRKNLPEDRSKGPLARSLSKIVN